jgi:centromere protein C
VRNGVWKDSCALLTSCRKTGIVLKDSGIRDKHGMEPIDGIFSSPEKTPSRRKRKSNQTITSESEMEIDQSMLDGYIEVPSRLITLQRVRSPIQVMFYVPAARHSLHLARARL